MKRNLKSVLTLLLAMMLLVCGAPIALAQEETPVADKWMIGDPENPITLSVFINFSWYSTESFTGIIPEEITRRTGIKLEPTRAVDNNQLGVLVASGELPDLVFTSKLLDTLSDPSVSYSYNELIDQYGLDWEVDNSRIVNAKAFSGDDHYYFLHSHAATDEDWQNTTAAPMVASMIYRHDMLEELGNPEIKNAGDLENVLGMVKDKWPDVTPLVFSVDAWYLNPLKTWNNCSLQYFDVDENGQCQIVAKSKPFYDYLKYCNRLYQKGLIKAECFSWDTAAARTEMCSGKAFANIGSTQYGPGYYSAILEEYPQAELREMMPLSDYKLNESDLGWAGTFITKNNKYPEESIRFMQFLFSEEGQKLTQWGREGIEYTIGEDGLPVFSQEWTESVDNNTNAEIYNPWFYFGGSKILEAEARCAVEPETFRESNNAIRLSYHNEPWYAYSVPKDADGDYKVIYDKMVDYVKTNGQAKVIISANDEEFETNYANFISQLDSIGVDALAEFMTPRLQEAMELFGASYK